VGFYFKLGRYEWPSQVNVNQKQQPISPNMKQQEKIMYSIENKTWQKLAFENIEIP